MPFGRLSRREQDCRPGCVTSIPRKKDVGSDRSKSDTGWHPTVSGVGPFRCWPFPVRDRLASGPARRRRPLASGTDTRRQSHRAEVGSPNNPLHHDVTSTSAHDPSDRTSGARPTAPPLATRLDARSTHPAHAHPTTGVAMMLPVMQEHLFEIRRGDRLVVDDQARIAIAQACRRPTSCGCRSARACGRRRCRCCARRAGAARPSTECRA